MDAQEKFLLYIREAGPEDAEELQRLLYITWLATYPNKKYGITRDDIEDYFAEKLTEEGLAKIAVDINTYETARTILVGIDHSSGTMVAMCRGVRAVRRGEPNKLCALYVLPGYQGFGVGKAMWNHLYRKHLNPYSCTITHAAQYNLRAIKFYIEKLGFTRTDAPILRDPRWKMKSGNIIPDVELCLAAKPLP